MALLAQRLEILHQCCLITICEAISRQHDDSTAFLSAMKLSSAVIQTCRWKQLSRAACSKTSMRHVDTTQPLKACPATASLLSNLWAALTTPSLSASKQMSQHHSTPSSPCPLAKIKTGTRLILSWRRACFCHPSQQASLYKPRLMQARTLPSTSRRSHFTHRSPRKLRRPMWQPHLPCSQAQGRLLSFFSPRVCSLSSLRISCKDCVGMSAIHSGALCLASRVCKCQSFTKNRNNSQQLDGAAT